MADNTQRDINQCMPKMGLNEGDFSIDTDKALIHLIEFNACVR